LNDEHVEIEEPLEVKGKLSDDDKKKLDAAAKTVEGTKAPIAKIKTAIDSYKKNFLKTTEACKKLYASITKTYAKAHEQHKTLLGSVESQIAVQEAMIKIIYETALAAIPAAGVASKVTGSLTELAGPLEKAAECTLAQVKIPSLDDMQGDGSRSGTNSEGGKGGFNWSQTKFQTDLIKVYEAALKLEPYRTAYADLVKAPVQLLSVIDSTRAENAGAADVGTIVDDANKLESAVSSAPTAATLAGPVTAARQMLAHLDIVAPTPEQAEREVWLKWMGSLQKFMGEDGRDCDILTNGKLQAKLEELGLWEKLKVQMNWYDPLDDDVAALAAEALSKILENKGSVLQVTVTADATTGNGYGSSVGTVSLPNIQRRIQGRMDQPMRGTGSGVVADAQCNAPPEWPGAVSQYPSRASVIDDVAARWGCVILEAMPGGGLEDMFGADSAESLDDYADRRVGEIEREHATNEHNRATGQDGYWDTM